MIEALMKDLQGINGSFPTKQWNGLTSCLTISEDDGNWRVNTHTMRTARWRHTDWASPDGVLLMAGSASDSVTEILSNEDDTTRDGFNM